LYTELEALKKTPAVKLSDLVKAVKLESGKSEELNSTYFRPGMNSTDVRMLYDVTKANSTKKATLLIADKSKRSQFL
jgi:hypothetical protein